MTADKIKILREEKNMTQSDLARRIGITRSSINAWEMGISVPSTQYIVELAAIFGVSTDYLLNVSSTATVDVGGLSEKQVSIIVDIAQEFRRKNNEQ